MTEVKLLPTERLLHVRDIMVRRKRGKQGRPLGFAICPFIAKR